MTDSWQSQVDLMWAWTAPFAAAAVNAEELRDGMRVLDVAAGTGSSAIPLAERAKAAGYDGLSVLATDLSPAMLEQLDKNAATAGVAAWVRTAPDDAQCMRAASSESMDLVVCVFALMLLPDPAACAAEMFRLLKPGGRLVTVTWQRAPSAEVLAPVAAELGLPLEPIEAAKRKLYSLATPEAVTALLRSAGFTGVLETEVFTHTIPSSMIADNADRLVANPMVGRCIASEKHTPAQTAEALRKVVRANPTAYEAAAAVIARAVKP